MYDEYDLSSSMRSAVDQQVIQRVPFNIQQLLCDSFGASHSHCTSSYKLHSRTRTISYRWPRLVSSVCSNDGYPRGLYGALFLLVAPRAFYLKVGDN